MKAIDEVSVIAARHVAQHGQHRSEHHDCSLVVSVSCQTVSVTVILHYGIPVEIQYPNRLQLRVLSEHHHLQ